MNLAGKKHSDLVQHKHRKVIVRQKLCSQQSDRASPFFPQKILANFWRSFCWQGLLTLTDPDAIRGSKIWSALRVSMENKGTQEKQTNKKTAMWDKGKQIRQANYWNLGNGKAEFGGEQGTQLE